jgi:aryl-alcohol dehydrogenase-like predicted oxidoreductase
MTHAMEMVKFGRSGLTVSRIAYGAGVLGGAYGGLDEDAAAAAVHEARTLGINLFDTAHNYGESEVRLGRILADHLKTDREEILIATKGGLRQGGEDPGASGIQRDSSPAFLRARVEESLGRLGIDYIDIYQVHWPDPDVPFEETAAALQELVDAGTIRHVGVSNFEPHQMDAFERGRPVETLQPGYHLLFRQVEDRILPYARRHDIGVMVYGALGHGLLTGTYDPSRPLGKMDWRRRHPLFVGAAVAGNLERVDALAEFARERGQTVRQLAIAWTLANPAVHTTIVGTTKVEHLREAVGAATIELTTEDLAQIDQIMQGAVEIDLFTPEEI